MAAALAVLQTVAKHAVQHGRSAAWAAWAANGGGFYTMGTTSYSSPFDTLITGPVPADKLQSDLLRTNHLQTLHFSYKGNAALCLSKYLYTSMYGLRSCTSEFLLKVNCRIEFGLAFQGQTRRGQTKPKLQFTCT